MKTVEVQMDLDPVNDGVKEVNGEKLYVKEEKTLIISTDGRSRTAGFLETMEIANKLRENCHGEFLGKTPYIMLINGDKIIKLETGTFFVGTAMIMKDEGDGRRMGSLRDEEIKQAEEEFKKRLVTLAGNGQEFPAYPLI